MQYPGNPGLPACEMVLHLELEPRPCVTGAEVVKVFVIIDGVKRETTFAGFVYNEDAQKVAVDDVIVGKFAWKEWYEWCHNHEAPMPILRPLR